jgi:ribosomal protein S12 methylthiotransferase
MKKKIHITSLGCAKNLVDSEVLAGQLKQRTYEMSENPSDADVIIVNTCGFINPAKEESIQAIFEAVKLKKNKRDKKVFVSGCLSQRYMDELKAEIPEVDALFGTEDYAKILQALGESDFHPEDMYKMRSLTTPKHFAYMKISEGCNHTCSFCAIPGIRGKHRSRSIEDILGEAEVLAQNGVKELLLVSQDTSYFGKDMYGSQRIVDLLEELARTGLFRWIRPLYWYPTNFPKNYLNLMQKYDSIIPYLDMPVQHASDRMLRIMRRGEQKQSLIELYREIRERVPEIALRTTLILGHPGETDEDYQILQDFLQEVRFDRVGTFTYSDEENTSAFELGDKVPEEIAEERRAGIMSLQEKISAENNARLIGTEQLALIDDIDPENNCYIGRTYRDAPEIDNELILQAEQVSAERIGEFAAVKITDATEFELYGEFDVTKKRK